MIKNCCFCLHEPECSIDHNKFNKYSCGIPCENWYPNEVFKINEFDDLHEALWMRECDISDAIDYIYETFGCDCEQKDPKIKKLINILRDRKSTDDCYKRIGY